MNWNRFFQVCGHYTGVTLRWFFHLLGDVIGTITRSAAQGIGAVLRATAPYLIGAGAVWYFYNYQTEFFFQCVTLVIIGLAFYTMVGGFRRKKRKKS